MTNELNPRDASTLAIDVYAVNSENPTDLRRFLNNKLFAQNGQKTLLKAEVGGRVFRAAKDAFGVCAPGAGNHQGDLFF